MAKALVIYFSKTGHTARMAQAVAKGFESQRVSVTLVEVGKATNELLEGADAIVLGSPCYYGTMAAEMKAFLDRSVALHGKLAGKVGGAFASSGMLGGGNETAVLSIVEGLLIHGMIVQGNARIGHYGPVAVGEPNEQALKECETYGARLGELVGRIAPPAA
jgi:NAD(P)H dehydrogenase (quinone)